MNIILLNILVAIFIVFLIVIITKIAHAKYSNIHTKLEAIEESIIRQLEESSENNYSQLEALIAIYHYIKPLNLLPKSRGWAASPDFLKLIIETIINEKPKIILEAGGGLSSIIVGYSLKQNKIDGKLFTLDDKFEYAEKTKQQVAKHGLNEFVNIIHAEIQDYNLKNESFKWYSSESFESLNKIDLLIIDGPGPDVSENPRYGSLPLLYNKLTQNSTIIVDDGDRKKEEKIVEAWINRYQDLKVEYVDLEKGAYILRKIN